MDENICIIPLHTRLMLAQELVSCVRMIVAKDLVASDNAEIVRTAIEHYYSGIINEGRKHNVSTEQYVFHHLLGNSYKYYVGTGAPGLKSKKDAEDVRHALMLNSTNEYDSGMVKNYVKKAENKKRGITMEKLEEIREKVEMEVDGCVILPKLFHDWLHHQTDDGNGNFTIKKTNEPVSLQSRTACYQLLNRYRSDKERLHELINDDFEGNSLNSAIKSLSRLISLAYGTEEKTIAIDKIHEAFTMIQNQMISHTVVD